MNWKKAIRTGTVFFMTVTTAFTSACSWFGKPNNPDEEKDDTAPVIVTSPANREVEIGFYNDLQQDIASAEIKDEESETVKRYPVSYSFNGKTTAIDKDATGFFISQIGEYVITYSAEDFAGNVTNGTYTLFAQDTTSPVVDVPAMITAWVEDGKVAIPTPKVVEIGAYVVDVTATTALGQNVAIVDGYLATSQLGTYVLNYTVKDASDNETTATTTLAVNEKGVINSFTYAGEASLWDGETRIENEKMVVTSKDDETSVFFNKYFTFNDWNGFERLFVDVENNRGMDLFVTAYVLADGVWQETATQALNPAVLDTSDFVGMTASKKTVSVDLANYGFEYADGLRLDFACRGGVNVAIDNVKLVETASDLQIPDESELTGAFKGVYALNAVEGVTEDFETAMTLPSGVNAITYDVFSSVNASVTIGLTFGGKTVYSRREMNVGWNSFTRLVAVEGADLTQEFTGVSIINEENYPVTLCVNNANATNVTSIAQSAYADLSSNTFAIAYGEEFMIPNPFKAGASYYSNVAVTLQGSSAEYAIGDSLVANENGLASGNYKIIYSYDDAFGQAKTLTYTLNVEKKVLAVDVSMPVLFMSGATELPDPTLSSDVYTNTQLKTAKIEKFYKESGKYTWIDGSETFTPVKSKTYDIRYVVTIYGNRREVDLQKYVHKSKNVIDFEPEDGAGVHSLRVVYGGAENGTDYGTQQSKYLYDGGIHGWQSSPKDYWFKQTTDWSKSGSTSLVGTAQYEGPLGIVIRPLMVTDEGERINAVSFWLKSDKPVSGAYIQLASFESKEGNPDELAASIKYPWAPAWPETERFDIKAGEHFYTVYMQDNVTVRSIGSFCIVGSKGATYYIDDIEFSYINRLSISEVDYEDSYDVSKAYKLEKPVLTSELFSESELANAKWSVKYTVNGGNEKELKADSKGNFALPATENGEIALTWYATVNGVTVKTSDSFIYGIVQFETNTPYVVNQGNTLVLSMPESSFTLDSVKVEYKFFEDSEWVELTEEGGYFSFVAEKQGQYNVRYSVSSNLETGAIYGEKIDNVYVPEKGVLFTFEDKDPRQGAGHFAENPLYHGAVVVEKEDGTHWMQIKKVGDSFDGLAFATPYDLGVNTTKLAFDVYSNEAQPIYIHFTTTEGCYELTKYMIPKGESVVEIDFAEYGATNIRYVKSLYFYLHFGNGYTNTAFFVDNIRLVNEMTMESNVPSVATSTSVTFTPKVDFSVRSPEDFDSSVTISASFREKGATSWSAMTSNNGTFNFNATALIYEVKVTATYNGQTLEEIATVYNQSAGTLLWDFESDWTNFKPFSRHSTATTRSTEWSATGEYSWRIYDQGNGLYGAYIGGDFTTPIAFEKTVTKVAFWTNCTETVRLCLHIGTDAGTTEYIVTIDPGVQYSVFDLVGTSSTLKHFYLGGAAPGGKQFMITGSSNPPLYIDDIVFYP